MNSGIRIMRDGKTVGGEQGVRIGALMDGKKHGRQMLDFQDVGVDEFDKGALSLYTNQKNKGEKRMSLVVVLMNKNGIAMASDSRSSIFYGELLELDEQFPERTKLFKGRKCIFATYGTNTVEVNYQRIPIENMIKEEIFTIDEPEKVINAVYAKLEKYSINNTRFNFVIGYKEDGIYCCKEFEVTNRKLIHNGYSLYHDCLVYGMPDMIPRKLLVSNRWTLEELEDRCKNVVESAIKLGDLFLDYNPVGGAIQSVTISLLT